MRIGTVPKLRFVRQSVISKCRIANIPTAELIFFVGMGFIFQLLFHVSRTRRGGNASSRAQHVPARSVCQETNNQKLVVLERATLNGTLATFLVFN